MFPPELSVSHLGVMARARGGGEEEQGREGKKITCCF